jgi:membrane fusion protein (multidrug efflux system)
VNTAENAIVVPQQAVTELQSAKVVYVVGPENKVQLRSVTLGSRAGGDYIVTEGLKAGERIIVEGILKVRPGVTVQPSEAPMSVEAPMPNKGA